MAGKTTAQIIDSQVICKQSGRYIGWPTIAQLPTGELLAAFSGDRDAHVCPFGKTFVVRSGDNGISWSVPELVNDSPFDDRDTGLCVCADGTVIVTWFTSHYLDDVYLRRCSDVDRGRWQEQLAVVTPEDIDHWLVPTVTDGRYGIGSWIRRSSDGGRTWENPIRVPVMTPHGPIQLADGRLLFVGTTGHERSTRRAGMKVAESHDHGQTWSVIAEVNRYPTYSGVAADGVAYFCEPHVVETEPGGRLVAMARYEEVPRAPERCLLYQFTSDDGGCTWTEPVSTGILGKPPHLQRLRDGRLLLTYGYRHAPYGQRACLSYDRGVTWDYDNEIILRNDAANGDLGYPASVELDDGTVLTVYYQVDQPGAKTCLMTTRWRTPE